MEWRCVTQVLVLLQVLCALTDACSCPIRHPQQHYCEADFVANVKVRRVVTLPDGQSVLKVRVRRMLKSSPKAAAALSKRLIYTIPGTCSLNVTSRSMHVITGDIQAGKPWTSACHFAAPWSSLAPKMKKGFRLLYQTGCDCPIMSCHWWERNCPSAAFFCSWRTSTEKEDCQARHGVCLRRPSGGCGWLGGRLYRGCMRRWRARGRTAPTAAAGHGRASVATLPLSGGASNAVHSHEEDNSVSDMILSNDVVDGVQISENRNRARHPTGRRVGPPQLGADTTYSFGPRVISRFHKPRKPKLRPHLNSVYSSRLGKPVKHGLNVRTPANGILNSSHNRRLPSPSTTTAKPTLTHDNTEFVFDNHIDSAHVPSRVENDHEFVQETNEQNKSKSSEWSAPGIERAGAYHRRRYPEYTTRIGYIPEN